MALAVDVIDRRGPSNSICLYNSKRRFSCSSLLARWNGLVLKVGVLYGLKITKCVVSYSQRRLR